MHYLSRACVLTPHLHHRIVEAGVVVDADFSLGYPMMQAVVGRVSGDDDKCDLIAQDNRCCAKAKVYWVI